MSARKASPAEKDRNSNVAKISHHQKKGKRYMKESQFKIKSPGGWVSWPAKGQEPPSRPPRPGKRVPPAKRVRLLGVLASPQETAPARGKKKKEEPRRKKGPYLLKEERYSATKKTSPPKTEKGGGTLSLEKGLLKKKGARRCREVAPTAKGGKKKEKSSRKKKGFVKTAQFLQKGRRIRALKKRGGACTRTLSKGTRPAESPAIDS